MPFANLFSQTSISSVKLKNRIVLAPMATGFFKKGHLTSQAKSFYIARARGGVGLILVGGVYITWPASADISSIGRHAHLKDDSVIREWQQLIRELHQYGAKVGVQLFHPGRQVSFSQWGQQAVSPSALPCPGIRELPKKLTLREIDSLVEYYTSAAQRAQKAGFDLIEIHGAHGYLVSSFLSPHSNRRKDAFGGNLENRARFALQIVKEIRKDVITHIPIGIRINGQDNVSGGIKIADATLLASLFEKSGVDFIDVSAGLYGSYPSLSPMSGPQGCFVILSEAIKNAVNVPVIGVGRIKDPQYADRIIKSKKADMVALGRALIADPDWPEKAFRCRQDSIRRCISCNQGCLDRIEQINFYGRKVSITCMLNPWVGRETEIPFKKAKTLKRILIIGGGPAGLAFSSIAARRGHHVMLIDKEKKLGGQFKLASILPNKRDISISIDYMIREAKKTGVIIKTGHTYNKKLLKKFNPNVVIVATGARPLIPDLPGVEKDLVCTFRDVLGGSKSVGERVLIVGGGQVGLEAADYFSAKGLIVQVVEMESRFGKDMGSVAWVRINRSLKNKGVKLTKSFKVNNILNRGVIGISNGSEEEIANLDSIVLAVGVEPRNEYVKEIKNQVPEVHLIGDVARPRNALVAIQEGAQTACLI